MIRLDGEDAALVVQMGLTTGSPLVVRFNDLERAYWVASVNTLTKRGGTVAYRVMLEAMR